MKLKLILTTAVVGVALALPSRLGRRPAARCDSGLDQAA